MGVERFDLTTALDLQIAVLRCQRSASLLGATDIDRSIVATIVAELGSNVLKYARRGTIELNTVRRGSDMHVEITASDDGPGIADVELAMRDHYSTGRTLGLGLPGVKRMADTLKIDARPGRGTVVRVLKVLRTQSSTATTPTDVESIGRSGSSLGWEWATSVRARAGQRSCGDTVWVMERGSQLAVAAIDATGHGPAAQAVAETLSGSMTRHVEASDDRLDPVELARAAHEAATGTIGASLGVAVVDRTTGHARFLAVGNVRAASWGRARFRGVARDGVLGRRWPTPFVQRLELDPNEVLALWSDGLPDALSRLTEPPTTHGSTDGATTRDLESWTTACLARHGRTYDDAAMVAVWRSA